MTKSDEDRIAGDSIRENASYLRRKSMVIGGIATIIALAFGLRLCAVIGDFWLDEIVSHRIAMSAHSIMDILNRRIDNNHVLNTMFMAAIGDRLWWGWYRLPAVIASTATVLSAGWFARRWGTSAALIVMFLLGVSHPMVHYGSEARGYSLAMLAAIVSVLALESHVKRRTKLPLVLFWAAATAGMYSMALFVEVYCALAVWSAYVVMRSDQALRIKSQRLLVMHAMPLIVIAYYWASFVRRVQIAGGDESPALEVINRAAAMSLGGAEIQWLAWPASAVVTVLILVSLFLMRRQRDDLWIFFGVAMIVAPAAMVIVAGTPYMYERYFLLQSALLLIMLGYLLAQFTSGTRFAATCGLVMLAVFGSLNLMQVSRLLGDGRGNYSQAMRLIASRTPPGQPIIISSDHDSRNQFVVRFFARYIDRPVEYINRTEGVWPTTPWYIVHRFHGGPPVDDSFEVAPGIQYKQVASFDYASLSGFRWHVFERIREGEQPAIESRRISD